jgi:hypothetical protein
MSYDLRRSHFSVILEREVLPGFTITEEGVVLVALLDAATGTEKVKASTGTAADVVAGFAIRDNADNATTSEVEEATIPTSPAALTVQLGNNNLVAATPGTGSTTQIEVVASTTGILTIANAGAPAGGSVGVNDLTGELTFNAAQEGEDVVVTYRYNLTVAESRLKFFQRNINNEAGALFGQVGAGHGHGEIFTDQFDATVDWSSNPSITSGAAGILTTGGSGAVLDARVISVPNVNNPLLGIAFDLGGAAT